MAASSRGLGRHVRQCAYERAGARIDVDLGRAETHPHATRRPQLTRDDESRSAAAEKENRARQLREDRKLRERSVEERSRWTSEPAFEHRGVDAAEVGRRTQVAHVECGQVGMLAVQAALDAAADQEDRRGFAVVGAAAARSPRRGGRTR